jgi:prophage antirepressor-like protein
MNELQIFNHETFGQIRVVFIDGEPWLVLKDVCDALELSNARVVADRLDDDEVRKFDLRGQTGEVNIINESGLYNVILRSDKPEAKEFRRWVTHDVLPSIRKTGAYIPNCAVDVQRINTLIRMAEHRAVPVAEQRRLLDMAARALTGEGISVPEADEFCLAPQNSLSSGRIERILRGMLDFSAPIAEWRYMTSAEIAKRALGDANEANRVGIIMTRSFGYSKNGEIRHKRLLRGACLYLVPPTTA